MEKNAEEIPKQQPNCTENDDAATLEDTTPNDKMQEITVPVKFNKEIRRLSVEQAGNLAQKGLKLDLILPDFERIKQLAAKDGKTVGEFIGTLENQRSLSRRDELLKISGGNEELAEHILELEKNADRNDTNGFEELKKNFPRFKDVSELPVEVVENSRLKGSRLLDEYLRYRLFEERSRNEAKKAEEQAALCAVGSQKFGQSETEDPTNAEFLKGLWGR